MGIVYHHVTGQAAADAVLSDPYGDAYEEIYAEPPYNAGPLFTRDRFTERTVSQVSAPGFELIAAEDHPDLAGFCFGFTMAEHRWWGGTTTPPPPDIGQVPKLAVIELILRKKYRGWGIGRRLLGELLADRPERYATLLSHPSAPAHALYEQWGWRVVGTCQPASDAPFMDVMVIDLLRM